MYLYTTRKINMASDLHTLKQFEQQARSIYTSTQTIDCEEIDELIDEYMEMEEIELAEDLEQILDKITQ